MMKGIIAFTALISILAASGDIKIILSENSDETRTSIMRIIPQGTDIDFAKMIMEKNGFECKLMKDSSFSDMRRVYGNIDFLYCSKESGFIIGKRWQVAIVTANLQLKDVYVSYGITGP